VACGTVEPLLNGEAERATRRSQGGGSARALVAAVAARVGGKGSWGSYL
jgi:hypothetical protein